MIKKLQDVSQDVFLELEKSPDKKDKNNLHKIKQKIARKYSLPQAPRNINLFLSATEKQRKKFSNLLLTKPTRTISGVAPLALFTRPMGCPPQAKCIFCPGGPGSFFGNVPKSYTGNEPASRRAARNHYDPYLQVFNRLEHYSILNQNFEKLEVITMGGTFQFYPEAYRKEFMMYLYKAVNDFSKMFYSKNKFNYNTFKEFFELPCSNINDKERTERIHTKLLKMKTANLKTLEQEKKLNETSRNRTVTLLIETRPDLGMLKDGNEILSYGGTKVELGVQSVYDNTLDFVKRGHNVQASIDSTRILKDLSFKINYHYMLGLTEDRKKDLKGIKQLFSNPDFKPDMLKIYPCLVMPGTPLFDLWKHGEYHPISVDECVNMITKVKKIIPPWVRIQRIQRDIPSTVIAAGPIKTNLRQLVQESCKKHNIQCQCIRCREPMNHEINWDYVKLIKRSYEASHGQEDFISYEDTKNNLILGFCRLRIPSQILRNEITSSTALIRELHVYGPAANPGNSGIVQHKGLGKALMYEAEKLAKEKYSKNKMVVIAGVGVREYYKKLGYSPEGPYISKKI